MTGTEHTGLGIVPSRAGTQVCENSHIDVILRLLLATAGNVSRSVGLTTYFRPMASLRPLLQPSGIPSSANVKGARSRNETR
jgi:hypothetical protein